MKRRSRYKGTSAARVLFKDNVAEEVIKDPSTESDTTSCATIDCRSPSPMTSPFFHQTMDTQTQEADNYIEGLEGDYITRLRFWIEKTPGVSTYAVQLTAIFEAGSCINTNMLEKTPEKFKEMALKYTDVCKKIGLNGILLPSEVMKMKILKHATKKQKKKLDAIREHSGTVEDDYC